MLTRPDEKPWVTDPNYYGMSPASAQKSWEASQRRAAGDTALAPAMPVIKATPFQWRDPSTIPPRQFLYERHYIRKFISTTVGQPGIGKSSLNLVEAVAMASGKPLIGFKVKAPLRVWYWNGEDPADELQRRVIAICIHFDISPFDLGDRLFLDSGRTSPIVIATEAGGGIKVAEPVIDAIKQTLVENGIDVMIVDASAAQSERWVHMETHDEVGRRLASPAAYPSSLA
jgi:hypothetical protein